MKEFLNKANVIAVVGASRNKEKYGYKIYKALKNAGYHVYPINPNTNEIDGDKCYANLKDLPKKPDVVITITKPNITELIVEQAANLGINKIWMQPGSESKKAKELCKKYNISFISEMCFVVDGLNVELDKAVKGDLLL